MLTQLSIRNIVLIESSDLALADGLCVLSGETGAGKSILLDALGLVLGARADTGLIRQGEAQGTVTAEFDISRNKDAQQQLSELELEPSDTLIIRRSVTSDGKTRCLINDQAVTVAALRKIGETLVEIHGQHDQKSLQDGALHRELLDGYAGLDGPRKQVAEAYGVWRTHMQAMETLRAEIEKVAREQEYLQHMRAELSHLSPQPGEEESLADKRTTMMQSEKLFEILNETIAELNSGKGVAGALRSAQRTLTRSPITSGGAFAAIIEGLEKAAIEAEEALYALEKTGEEATFNPQKLESIEERLFALRAAARKYNLPADELPGLLEEVESKLALIDTQSHRLQEVEARVAESRAVFVKQAEKLTEVRKKAAVRLEKSIEKELAPLKMAGTRFRVALEVHDEAQWSQYGMDSIRFECATNVTKSDKDVAYAPLNKIASGGELSRFMLAMKVALASVRSTPTIIFDEIDTGTGGAVAAAIGERLALLGKHAQVLVVTHLPQVAARGSQHLLVSKQETKGKVVTRVDTLTTGQREEELARMLAGATITTEARKAAQKLLEQAA